jgi:AraC family transcriptional regulator of adaptative response/methylated-DNA-[protein]-cysteine methyltransferase
MIMVAPAITNGPKTGPTTGTKTGTKTGTMTTRSKAPSFASDAARWQAVQRRDRAADGAFWYSVRTTGVYCRPSCAARLPRRENVAFHASPAAAEKAGFRPCKRCRSAAALAERQAAAVAKACRLIERADEMPSLTTLAKSAGMSRFHFHRVFKSATGVTPKAYADANRAQRVRDALAARGSVTAAIYDAGFNSSGRFYAAAPGVLGMTPRDFRAGGTGAAIRFAVGQCSLGAILVAATQKGVCAIFLGDDPEPLVRELQDRFPKAQLIGADAEFERLVARVVGLVEAPAQDFDLPLDLLGTAFQQKVWQALRKVPAGSTATYTEIARRIGRPKAVRAVAAACGDNPIAIAIPCHRVVRLDGNLAGYRWGIARKRALLDKEAAA